MISALRSRWARRALIALAIAGGYRAGRLVAGRPKPIPVVLTEIGRGRVEATIANTRAGTVEACQRTKLSTIVGGRIEVLTVKEGDRVKKGQLLMRLWNDDQQAAERLAQAQLETSRKRVEEACTIAAAAEREVARQVELHKQGFISAERDRHRARGRRREGCRLRDREGRRRAGRGQRQAVACPAWPHGVDRAVRRHRRQIVGEIGEYLDAVAAGRADAAGDRPDRRVVPVRQGSDGRGRCAEGARRTDRSRIARRAAGTVVSRQGPAYRSLRDGGREAGAYGRHRGDVRRSVEDRAPAGRHTAPTSRSCLIHATTCCECRPPRCSKATARWSSSMIGSRSAS